MGAWRFVVLITYLVIIWGLYRDNGKENGNYYGILYKGYMGLLEVRSTYNLLSNCSYNPIISRVTVVMGFIIGL